MKNIGFILLISLLVSCNSSAQKKELGTAEKAPLKITKTDAEWKAILTADQYYILRQAGTEQAFSSSLNKNDKPGIYVCAACKTPVFKSEYKFDSGTGWPSFDREIIGNVAFSTDRDLGYVRTEEHCAVCGGHLGHVFDDGPRNTTGKRHCINGTALEFVAAK